MISVVIVIMDFGSPFYVSKRVGYGRKVIGVLKFRSMKSGADNLERYLTSAQIAEYKKEYKLTDDPRLIGYKKSVTGISVSALSCGEAVLTNCLKSFGIS